MPFSAHVALFRTLRRIWQVIDAAGTVAWLTTLGGPSVATSIAGLAAYWLGVPGFFIFLLALGVLLLTAAVVISFWERRARTKFRTLHRAAAQDAGGQARMVMSHVLEAMRAKGEPYHPQLKGLLEKHVLTAAEQSLTALASRVDARFPRFDTRDVFIEFFKAYQLQIEWLHEAGRLASYDFSADGNYGLWKTTDSKFLEALDKLLAETSDSALRKEIRAQNWPQGGQREYW
jgi:hypothetical protein